MLWSFLSGYHPESVPSTCAVDSKFERATSYTTVNIDESVQGNRSVEYFFSSDARYIQQGTYSGIVRCVETEHCSICI